MFEFEIPILRYTKNALTCMPNTTQWNYHQSVKSKKNFSHLTHKSSFFKKVFFFFLVSNAKRTCRIIWSNLTNHFQSFTRNGKDSKGRKMGATWIHSEEQGRPCDEVFEFVQHTTQKVFPTENHDWWWKVDLLWQSQMKKNNIGQILVSNNTDTEIQYTLQEGHAVHLVGHEGYAVLWPSRTWWNS